MMHLAPFGPIYAVITFLDPPEFNHNIYLTICISKAQKRKKEKKLPPKWRRSGLRHSVLSTYRRMPSPTSSFATKSRVAKVDVGLGILHRQRPSLLSFLVKMDIVKPKNQVVSI